MISTVNPVARILGVMMLTTPLLLSVDIVSAAVALAATVVFAPLIGVPLKTLAHRGFILFIVCPISGISMALYGYPRGTEYFSFLFAHVTDNSLSLAAAIMVRVLAVGLPVVVVLHGVDPTDLGDGLTQLLKLPPRFVIGAVAGARLVSLFRRDWDALRRSRRVRGLDGHGRIRRALTMTFALLVLAIRRGSKLATAMEARGFGGDTPRTWARQAEWKRKETLFVLGCSVVSVSSIAIAVVTGSFRFMGI